MAQKYKIIFNNQTKNANLHATDGEKDGKAEKERRKKNRKPLLDFLHTRLGDPLGARTQDPNIKSVVLYQLS